MEISVHCQSGCLSLNDEVDTSMIGPFIQEALDGLEFAKGDAAAFLADLRMVSPSVVVLVDSEGWADMTTLAAASSFRRGVVSSLKYYSMILELLDVSTAGGGGEWVRRIGMMHLRPKVGWKMEGRDEGERGRKAEKH
ncbi:Alpha-L-arabinofuranosidase 1 [Vigna angularis]|uniref:Alpha-L-arabinofuranosidase 1 n=1 Tax=Phaseolus angularis TaxID=3914 RepID=A0A8T0LFP0_PHAAN|nr:Alpha-L-arabinofuranosidase 1 [Vigna angularis]